MLPNFEQSAEIYGSQVNRAVALIVIALFDSNAHLNRTIGARLALFVVAGIKKLLNTKEFVAMQELSETGTQWKVAHRNHKRVNDSDRCRLGRFLASQSSNAWGDRRSRSNLDFILEQAEPVETRSTPEGLVTMNTQVRLVALTDGKQRTVTLVYPDDLELASDGISVLDPLGTTLLGSQVGDVIQSTDNKCRFRIVEVIYQPEHVGAYHL